MAKSPIQKMVYDVATRRAKILDEFTKAYLAGTNVAIADLELVEEHEENKVIWYFKIKSHTKS